MKRGDIVLCRKSFKECLFDNSFNHIFIQDKFYRITEINISNNRTYIHFNDETGKDYWFRYDVEYGTDGFKDYFYTLKESRALKLNQLEELNNE